MGGGRAGTPQITAKDAHKNERDAKAAGKGSFAWAWALDQNTEVTHSVTEYQAPHHACHLFNPSSASLWGVFRSTGGLSTRLDHDLP